MSGLSTAGNFVTTDTAQDITGEKTIQDKLTLDGAVNAPYAAGQIDLKGDFQNIIQQFNSTFGNQILQGTNTAGAPVMPLGASLLYQSGTSDIIETEGKVVCPTAPAAGNDLTNKTYVDAAIAAGGGGLDFFVGRNLQSSITVSQNLRFIDMVSSSAVNFADNGGGTGTTAGARFLADADTAGEWLFGLTGMNLLFNGLVFFNLQRNGTTEGYLFNTSTTAQQWQNLNGIWTVTVAANDVITIRPQNSYGSNVANTKTTFWGIRLG